MITLRNATRADAQMIMDWRNDPLMVAMSFTGAPVSASGHYLWLEQAIRLPHNRIIKVAELYGAPCAAVWFDTKVYGADISINVAPAFRGQGLGSQVTILATAEAWQERPWDTITARIKPENAASIRAFTKAGYVEVARTVTVVTMIAERQGERHG